MEDDDRQLNDLDTYLEWERQQIKDEEEIIHQKLLEWEGEYINFCYHHRSLEDTIDHIYPEQFVEKDVLEFFRKRFLQTV